MTSRPRRSALYMPASNARAIEKARGLDCDVIILDLEDAVAISEKPATRELVVAARKDATIDWTLRENVRAQLRVLVKRILHKYGYPPDKQEKATQMVLEQAEALSAEWTA